MKEQFEIYRIPKSEKKLSIMDREQTRSILKASNSKKGDLRENSALRMAGAS